MLLQMLEKTKLRDSKKKCLGVSNTVSVWHAEKGRVQNHLPFLVMLENMLSFIAFLP